MAQDTKEEPEGSGNAAEGDAKEGFGAAFAERAGTEKLPEEAADKAATTDEAAPAASDEAPSKEGADDSSGSKADAFDPYAGMSPEQKAHWDKLAASERSQRGRVGALHKKLNSLTSGTQQPSGKSEDEASQGGEGDQAPANDRKARLKAAVEEYGDVIGPLAEEVAELRTKVETKEASATRDAEIEQDAGELAEAYKALEEQHSDYREIGESKEFADWVAKQPEKVVALLNSFDPTEVSLGLTLYKAESKLSSAVTKEEGEGGNGGASDDRRERQLRGSQQATTRGAPAATGVPNEFGSAFKARAKQQA